MSMSSSRIPYFAAVGGVRWDPITGCSNGPDVCAVSEGCWARKMAEPKVCKVYPDLPLDCIGQKCEDYGLCLLESFKPQFHPEALDAPLRTRKPKVIAVGFGGDIYSEGVDPEWRRQVFEVMGKCERIGMGHRFICLTKRPENIRSGEFCGVPRRPTIGVSVTSNDEADRIWMVQTRMPFRSPSWVSFEPVLGPCVGDKRLRLDADVAFAVIGGLSNGAGQVVKPEDGGTRPEYVQPLLNACHEAGVKVFLKNLQPIIKQLIDPRTGRLFKNQNEWREVPDEWRQIGGPR